MTPQEDAAFAFGQELLDFAIEFVAAVPSPSITSESPRDPRLIGLTLLCRSITNFRGALRADHLIPHLIMFADYQLLTSRAALGRGRFRGNNRLGAAKLQRVYRRKLLGGNGVRHGSSLGWDGKAVNRASVLVLY